MNTQTFDLNKMRLAPMQNCEMQEIDGGSALPWGPIIPISNTLISVGQGIIDGLQSVGSYFSSGFSDGAAKAQQYHQ